nr:MAG TPA: hypothetical protein [Caudoviricetes sp.]
MLTFPVNGDTITVEINKKEKKVSYLGYHHNLERMERK